MVRIPWSVNFIAIMNNIGSSSHLGIGARADYRARHEPLQAHSSRSRGETSIAENERLFSPTPMRLFFVLIPAVTTTFLFAPPERLDCPPPAQHSCKSKQRSQMRTCSKQTFSSSPLRLQDVRTSCAISSCAASPSTRAIASGERLLRSRPRRGATGCRIADRPRRGGQTRAPYPGPRRHFFASEACHSTIAKYTDRARCS